MLLGVYLTVIILRHLRPWQRYVLYSYRFYSFYSISYVSGFGCGINIRVFSVKSCIFHYTCAYRSIYSKYRQRVPVRCRSPGRRPWVGSRRSDSCASGRTGSKTSVEWDLSDPPLQKHPLSEKKTIFKHKYKVLFTRVSAIFHVRLSLNSILISKPNFNAVCYIFWVRYPLIL